MTTLKVKSKATFKDICYALEYGGETLLQTIRHDKGNSDWSLKRSGMPVDPSAAQKFLTDPHCNPLNDGLFPGSSQTYGWRQ
jgi:hypothetical protein